LFGPQIGRAGAKLVECDELLLVGVDEPLDAFGGADQFAFEAGSLGGGRVGGAQLGQALIELGLDQGGVGEQGSDLAPDEFVEVVGAHRHVGADAPVLVAVVV
jgi:hypothetical protein